MSETPEEALDEAVPVDRACPTARDRRRARRKGAGAGLREFQGRKWRVLHAKLSTVVLLLGLVALAVVYPLAGPWWAVAGFACAAILLSVSGLWLHKPEAALALVSCAVALGLVVVADRFWWLPVPLAVVPLLIAATIGPFAFGRRMANRGGSAVLCHAGVCASVAVMFVSVPVGVGVALAWILVVVSLRGGGRVLLRLAGAWLRSGVQFATPDPFAKRIRAQAARDKRTHQFDAEWVRRGMEMELNTAALLETLGPQWHMLHSRALPGTPADVDHLVIGPAGVFLVDSKDWRGEITEDLFVPPTGLGTLDDAYTAYVLNGSEDELRKMLEPTVFEARKVADSLHLRPDEVRAIVAMGERMTMPSPVLKLTVDDDAVDILPAASLPEYLSAFPELPWKPGRRARQSAIGKQVADLAAAADYTFPPARLR